MSTGPVLLHSNVYTNPHQPTASEPSRPRHRLVERLFEPDVGATRHLSNQTVAPISSGIEERIPFPVNPVNPANCRPGKIDFDGRREAV